MNRPSFRFRFVLVGFGFALALYCVAGAANWPQWRGPQRNGVSQETGLLTEWPEDGPTLLWQKPELGGGYSTPAVVSNRLYILGSAGLDNEFVQALDVAQNGEQIWRKRIGNVGEPEQRPPYPGARSTPTVDGDRLYVLGSDGDLLCLNAASGDVIWQKSLRNDFGGDPGEWAYSESPLVDGDTLIVTPGGAEATIVALDKNTGEPIWKTPIEGGEEAGYASVVISNAGGVKQYVQFLGKGMVGVDAASGKLLWRYNRTAEGSPANIPTPLVHEDYVYTASGRGGGALINLNKTPEGFVVEEMYHDGNLPKAIGGTVLVGDYIYGTTNDALKCIELATGDVKWQDRALGAASICVAEGHLYLHGENGEVALVEATPDGYREKGRFTPPAAPDRGSSKAWAYPVVADGKLFIYDTGLLWCFDIGA
jgi:outer membrane protein assembly factor BamB